MAKAGRPTTSTALLVPALVMALAAPGRAAGGEAAAPDAAAVEFFEAKVRPVLVARCLSCHGPEKQKAGLRLDSREAAIEGGESGPAVVPGDAAKSLLVDAVNYGETVQMPPKSRLAAAEVEALTRWVATGAAWPAGKAGASKGAAKEAFDLDGRKAAHWAWRPVAAAAVPAVKSGDWPLDPVDRFLLARLEAEGLPPGPDADRRALIRRLTFDLTGLPPTPAEAEAFARDAAADAVERVVDRLLASPRFGERWGRHWLDLVRYAETRGHEFDPAIPNAWRYRDYVVRALNTDVPYDQFVTEHLAGDLASPPRVDPATGGNESVLGTGFWFLGEAVHSPVDVRQDESDRVDNQVDVFSKAFLGLTVACARCHDHKFDAISQRDYYALTGVLASSSYRQARFATGSAEREASAALGSLRGGSRGRILKLAAFAARPGVDRLATDLLAARASGLGVEPPATPCDPERVGRWANVLKAAAADPAHPLHPFAALACDPGSCEAPAFARRVDAWSAAPRPDPSPAARVVADFGTVDSLAGAQDGFAFGPRPVRPGDLFDGDRAAGLGLATFAAARRDPAFARLPLAEGDERDHGRLGSWERSGQTLRTPEFALGSGRLWYLARGAGRAYAAVNSHTLVAGPLHGELMTEWTDGGKGWRWVRHDLAKYHGHRTHVEFCASGAGPLEVARVVEADAMPPLPDFAPSGLREALAGANSPADLARRYQALFADTLGRMEADRLGDDSAAVAVADFVLRSAGWLGEPEASRDLASATSAFFDARDRIAAAVNVPGASAPAMLDGNGVDEPLLIRGSTRTPGPVVPRRFLEAIAGGSPIADAGSGRLELARRVLSADDPFASRVMVNRVWHHLFGRGIVASVDNFGVLGEPPTHPELLDFLADRFVRDGWSVKRLVRSLVLTRAYRMASRSDPGVDARDPMNRLLHRMPVRRLEAEPLRDAILAASGRLDPRMGGPGVPVHLTEFMQGRGRPGRSGPPDGDGRRSVYLEIRRNFLPPMMLAFDAPIPFSTMGRRNVSNVPAQALILLNDPFVAAEADRWAGRVLADPDGTPGSRLDAMYRTAFARPPRPEEVAAALAFLDDQGRERGLPEADRRSDRRAWADLAHVLFNAKEFLFLD